jgi:hypothetical protein
MRFVCRRQRIIPFLHLRTLTVIVAPLMTLIQGLMVSSVLTNRDNWFFSLFMVCTGVGSVILIGFLFGSITTESLYHPNNNDQVSSRIIPALTDLIAASATGMVGAISIGKFSSNRSVICRDDTLKIILFSFAVLQCEKILLVPYLVWPFQYLWFLPYAWWDTAPRVTKTTKKTVPV